MIDPRQTIISLTVLFRYRTENDRWWVTDRKWLDGLPWLRVQVLGPSDVIGNGFGVHNSVRSEQHGIQSVASERSQENAIQRKLSSNCAKASYRTRRPRSNYCRFQRVANQGKLPNRFEGLWRCKNIYQISKGVIFYEADQTENQKIHLN